MIKLRRVFFYFLPWLGRKFWTKVTKGTGSTLAAGATFLFWILFVPNAIIKGICTLNQKYIFALNDSGQPLVHRGIIMGLLGIVMYAIGFVVILLIAVGSKGAYLPPPGETIETISYLILFYNVYVLFSIAYIAFEKEQEKIVKDLSE